MRDLSTNEKVEIKYRGIAFGNRLGRYYKMGELRGFMAGSTLIVTTVAVFKGEWIAFVLTILFAVAVFIQGHRKAIESIEADIEDHRKFEYERADRRVTSGEQ